VCRRQAFASLRTPAGVRCADSLQVLRRLRGFLAAEARRCRIAAGLVALRRSHVGTAVGRAAADSG
jgi:hypothetical protein